jgi:hypothetical protein
MRRLSERMQRKQSGMCSAKRLCKETNASARGAVAPLDFDVRMPTIWRATCHLADRGKLSRAY